MEFLQFLEPAGAFGNTCFLMQETRPPFLNGFSLSQIMVMDPSSALSFMVTIPLARQRSSLFLICITHFFFFAIFSHAIFPGFAFFPPFFPPRPNVFTNVSSTKKTHPSRGPQLGLNLICGLTALNSCVHTLDCAATHSKEHGVRTVPSCL